MANSAVQYHVYIVTIAGNRCTVVGHKLAITDAGAAVPTAIAAVSVDLLVEGDIHGFLRFPFADPESLQGVLMPTDLAGLELGLTQGGADAVLGLIVEEIYPS